jgi:hypothetical protein
MEVDLALLTSDDPMLRDLALFILNWSLANFVKRPN